MGLTHLLAFGLFVNWPFAESHGSLSSTHVAPAPVTRTARHAIVNLTQVRRRRFIQTIAATPAVPALIATEATAQQTSATSAAVQPLAVGRAGVVADPVPHFFTAPQFAALRKLSDILLPPMGGNPGALDAGVPEFLDFLIGASPADRQQLYRGGLNLLNVHATTQFHKPFAELDAKQADAVVRPLLVTVAWAYDPPKDIGSHFLIAAQEDIRTATRNSREWSAAAVAAGHRATGAQQYWNAVDPIYKG